MAEQEVKPEEDMMAGEDDGNDEVHQQALQATSMLTEYRKRLPR
jgi:hypothetical protein